VELLMTRKDEPNWGKLAALGMEVAIGVVLGALVGNWLDRKYHWDPWGTLIGTVVGFAAGMYSLAKAAMGANNDKD
jgi:F0F1-type ATP synthase assembly protein I